MENDPEAWNDYLKLCELGGSKSFLGLVEAANLKSPFTEGTVKSVVEAIDEWLSSVDDQNL